MIRVNLLPFRAARKKENIRRQISIFLLSLIFAAVLLTYYHISLSSKIGELETKVENTNKKLIAYQKKAKEVDKIKKQLDTLNKKTKVIKDLELNRKAPVHLMDAMTDVVVKNRMWFTNFKTGRQDVSIKGVALDNQTVADFMTRLERSKLFRSVNLKTLSRKKIKRSMDLKSFAITCRTAPFKKPAKGKAKG